MNINEEDIQCYYCPLCRTITDWHPDGRTFRCTGKDGLCVNRSRLLVDVDMAAVSWKTPEQRREAAKLAMREKRKKLQPVRRKYVHKD